ncbi:hypothetical protein OF83DRAFT_1177468, partial [Amylostereum chailletii]
MSQPQRLNPPVSTNDKDSASVRRSPLDLSRLVHPTSAVLNVTTSGEVASRISNADDKETKLDAPAVLNDTASGEVAFRISGADDKETILSAASLSTGPTSGESATQSHISTRSGISAPVTVPTSQLQSAVGGSKCKLVDESDTVHKHMKGEVSLSPAGAK